MRTGNCGQDMATDYVCWKELCALLTSTCNMSPKPIALFSKHLPHFTTKTQSSSTWLRKAFRENNDANCTWLPTLAK
ncbi:uncharacterized [Tachysurus ichikawai]